MILPGIIILYLLVAGVLGIYYGNKEPEIEIIELSPPPLSVERILWTPTHAGFIPSEEHLLEAQKHALEAGISFEKLAFHMGRAAREVKYFASVLDVQDEDKFTVPPY